MLESPLIGCTRLCVARKDVFKHRRQTRRLFVQVMAVNLMGLEGKQVTVAVVGLAHVDGIEGILMANGWKSQRC